jgi:hypothetical protein
MIILAPSFARRIAMALPIPLLAPVIKMVLFVNGIVKMLDNKFQ